MPQSSTAPAGPRGGAARPKRAKDDLRLARLEAKREWFRAYATTIEAIKVVAWIAASWIPLQAIKQIAVGIAGKDTKFDANLNITIAISVALSVSWAITWMKLRRHKAEVLRLRMRNDALERLLDIRGLDPGNRLA